MMTVKQFRMTTLLSVMGMLATMLSPIQAYAEHMQLNGMVAKIQSNVVFAKTPWGLRMIGTTKQLHDVGIGDRVAILLNEDNNIIDVHKDGEPAPRHTVVNGHLIGSTPAKNTIRLWTSEGKKVLPVATSAIARFNAIPVGSPVAVEVNERGQVIDARKIAVPVPNKT